MIHTIFTTLAYAETTSAAPPQPSTIGMILPFLLMLPIFYFLIIRPQQTKAKEQEELIKNLQKGEEVVTTSGILGKIHGVADKFVTLEVDQNVRIKVLKTQVATILKGDAKI